MFCVATSVMLSSCSWHYEAYYHSDNGNETVEFELTGYDVLYGESLGGDYTIVYPSSARDRATNTVQAKDFTQVGQVPTEKITGYIVVEPHRKVESRLVEEKKRYDGSVYASEMPFNGAYKLKSKGAR